MSRTIPFVLALAAAIAFSACTKMSHKATVNADNTGSLVMKMSYKTEAIENLKSLASQMGGGEDGGEMDENLKKLDEAFDEKKISEKLKKQGLEVKSTKAVEKDGWKGVEVEADIKDVNAWVEAAGKESEKSKDDDHSMGPMSMPGGNMNFAPKFYKTDTAGVGEIVLIPPMNEAMEGMGNMPDLDEMDEDQRAMVEAMMDNIKAQLSVDEMLVEMTIKLPGAVAAVKGCKKVDDHTVLWTMKGADMTLDGVKTMFGMKDGVSATFQIPEGCKINFADPPKKAAKPAEEKKDETEPKEKKGGLKIGDEKKGG